MNDFIPDVSSLPAYPLCHEYDRKSVRSVNSDSSDTTLVEDHSDTESPPLSPLQKEGLVTLASSNSPPASPCLNESASPPTVLPQEQWSSDPVDYVIDANDLWIDANAPIPLGSCLVKTIGDTPYIPDPLATFDYLLECKGAVWTNKTSFVHSLCPARIFSGDYRKKLSMVRRPLGFGQRTFMTTAEFSYGYHSKDIVDRLLGPSPSTSLLKDGYLTLFVEMSQAFEGPSDNLADAMNNYMNRLWTEFMFIYHEPLGLSRADIDCYGEWPSSESTFDWILNCVSHTPYRLLIFVDECNHPLIHSTPDTIQDIVGAISHYLVQPMRAGITGQMIVGGMILGQPVSEEPLWVEEAMEGEALFESVSRDISLEFASSLHGAFGFTWAEVEAMTAEVLPSMEDQARCLGELRQLCATYGEGPYIEYSVDDVLTYLRRETLPPYSSPEMPPWPSDEESDES